MKINRQISGQTLIILLIVVAIIAILTFSRLGMFSNLMGTKEQPGAVRVDMNKLQQQTEEHNNQVRQQMEADINKIATATATSTDNLSKRNCDVSRTLSEK
jgi:Tfp pilus assembly protein PilE